MRQFQSPMLFNAVVDMFMDKIDKSIGVTAGSGSQEKYKYIDFAGDLLLLSSTDIGMKTMMKQLEAEMANVGLVMNPEKCASMRTEVISKRKQWIVNQTLSKATHSKNTFVAKSGSLSDFRKAFSRIP